MPTVTMEVQVTVTSVGLSPNGNLAVKYQAAFGATTLEYEAQGSLPPAVLTEVLRRADTIATNNLLQKRESAGR